MSKRRPTPALYEMIQSSTKRLEQISAARGGEHDPEDDELDFSPASEPRPAAAPPGASTPSSSSSSSWIETTSEPTTAAPGAGPIVGGRIMRVPVGYVIVAAGGVLVLLLVAYSVGFSRGNAREGGGGLAGPAGGRQGNSLPIFDPIEAGGNGAPEGPIDDGAGSTGMLSGATGSGPQNAQPDERLGRDSAPGLYEDTRRLGLNYIFITRTDRDEAEDVADFLISRGVDVMLVQDKNLWQVVSRRGFESWSSDADAQRLLQTIISLGREWKTKFNGASDFSDAYGVKYRG